MSVGKFSEEAQKSLIQAENKFAADLNEAAENEATDATDEFAEMVKNAVEKFRGELGAAKESAAARHAQEIEALISRMLAEAERDLQAEVKRKSGEIRARIAKRLEDAMASTESDLLADFRKAGTERLKTAADELVSAVKTLKDTIMDDETAKLRAGVTASFGGLSARLDKMVAEAEPEMHDQIKAQAGRIAAEKLKRIEALAKTLDETGAKELSEQWKSGREQLNEDARKRLSELHEQLANMAGELRGDLDGLNSYWETEVAAAKTRVDQRIKALDSALTDAAGDEALLKFKADAEAASKRIAGDMQALNAKISEVEAQLAESVKALSLRMTDAESKAAEQLNELNNRRSALDAKVAEALPVSDPVSGDPVTEKIEDKRPRPANPAGDKRGGDRAAARVPRVPKSFPEPIESKQGILRTLAKNPWIAVKDEGIGEVQVLVSLPTKRLYCGRCDERDCRHVQKVISYLRDKGVFE